ncbi:membrane protease YdiL (CAAX protease family) [Pedobacter sp. UYP30]|uniref:CPBP family intramembrane glutamic endopeptidase n=1 Tax=Pedobacter sp. UYP30 TaxID=1756400 RepID=UPI00339AD701
MKTISSYKSLLYSLVLFALFGAIIWTINVLGQSIFPGYKLFPLFMRSIILAPLLMLCYYVNYRFIEKNALNNEILKFKAKSFKLYLGGIALACLLLATIWVVIYLIYPFEIIRNSGTKVNFATDLISYSMGNTLEELLFRGFLLVAAIRLFGKIGAIFFVSLLFGLFHLQGLGMTRGGLTMVITTFTMALLFTAVIYYTKSIWTAVTLHIAGNLILHTFGFDGTNNGLFEIRFCTSNINGNLTLLIYEFVIIAFALFLFLRSRINAS